jgi:hypothetical protein
MAPLRAMPRGAGRRAAGQAIAGVIARGAPHAANTARQKKKAVETALKRFVLRESGGKGGIRTHGTA